METAERIEHSIDDAFNKDSGLRASVTQAAKILADIIGSTAIPVTAQWKLLSGEIQLILSDVTGAKIQAKFSPKELSHEGILTGKFSRIWGDLLQSRSHQQLNHLAGKDDIGQ